MSKTSVTRTCSVILGACIALVCLFASSAAFAQGWQNLICDREQQEEAQDSCDATPFLAANIGSTQAESFHYTTDHTLTTRQFLYDWLGGPSPTPLSAWNSATVENGLYFECDGAVVTFPPGNGKDPEPRDYVTLIFSDFGPEIDGVNFLAVNSSGQVVDEATKQTNSNQDFQVVTLGPHYKTDPIFDITKVYMWHVQTNTCNRDCTEPVISEVRACDIDTL